MMVLLASPVRAADVEGRITRVGLFAGSTPIIRPGVWSFVEVELRTRSQKPFDGRLSVDQLDRDGDVATAELPVALAPGGDWRPYQVYFVPYDQQQVTGLKVRLFDAAGRQTSVLDETGREVRALEGAKNIVEINPDDYLIVDLSNPKRLPHVAWLDVDRARQRNGLNARIVRTMAPRELPSKGHGLEAVDAIVWDDADPTELSRQQCDALLDWVKAGGRLLLSGGRNWQALTNSPLADALPVTITGLIQTQEAQDFLELVEGDLYRGWLDRQHQKQGVSRCVMQPREEALPVPAESAVPPMTFRRLLGRGNLTFVGASLRQLLPPPKQFAGLEDSAGDLADGSIDDGFLSTACERVIARRLLALPAVVEEEDHSGSMRMRGFNLFGKQDLFDQLRWSIGFESVGGAFLLFAILFATAYTLAATTGSYLYMKRRSWEHHAWTAFAAVAIVGSVAGTGMVWLLRGFSTKLWQTTIIDAHAGREEAYACALFGVKTPDHTRLNLRLPTGGSSDAAAPTCPLRAVAKSEGLDRPESRFVASDRYRSTLAGTALEAVPFRATLKELQGAWHGPLNGTFEGRLVARRNTGEDADRIRFEFGEGSFLANKLNVNLRDCVLITMPVDGEEEVAGERPVVSCHCFVLGDLSKGVQLTGEQINEKLFFEPVSEPAPTSKRKRIRKLPLLSDALNNWTNQISSQAMVEGYQQSNAPRQFTPQQELARLLLLSTYNLLRPNTQQQFPFIRTYGRTLDCTHQLTRRSALLIGWTDEAPPVVLEKNLTNLRPERSRTIYRFLIPVEKK